MPRSVFILFVSQYPNHSHLEIGDQLTARIKAFNYELRVFKLIKIEETIEDGHTVYVYYGVYVGHPHYG